MLQGCRASRATYPFPRLHDWSAGGLLPYSAARFVRVSCRSPNSMSPTRTTCCGQVASILVQHVRHARLPRDMLATSSHTPREDVKKMLRGLYEETAPVELQLSRERKAWYTARDIEAVQTDQNHVTSSHQGTEWTVMVKRSSVMRCPVILDTDKMYTVRHCTWGYSI